jgi:hypothetical protein
MQGELGDVVYVELPAEGHKLNLKDTFGVVESVKTASDVYAPVSGEVVAANSAASDDPSKVCAGDHLHGSCTDCITRIHPIAAEVTSAGPSDCAR